MKKVISVFLIAVMLLGMTACAKESENAQAGVATEQDIAHLENVYAGTAVFHGELHDHSNSGGRSDGKQTLDTWKTYMEILDFDFAAIVDHKQVRHMFLEEWDETKFIGGTEAAVATFTDMGQQFQPHYNMIFSSAEPLIEVLEAFPEFNYSGGDPLNAEFPSYPGFTRERFGELIDLVKEKGGFFAIAHPRSGNGAEIFNPVDFWFRDWTGLEVIYTYRDTRDGAKTAANYKLWRDLLRYGRKIWATAGNDEHNIPSDKGLSTVYATDRHADAFLESIRVGNFTAGPVGIRMCIGDTPMGSECDFTGQRLVFSVGDFHNSVVDAKHTYRVDIYAGETVLISQQIQPDEVSYFALDVEDVPYYRIEVFDETLNSRIAIGNPIWQKNAS